MNQTIHNFQYFNINNIKKVVTSLITKHIQSDLGFILFTAIFSRFLVFLLAWLFNKSFDLNRTFKNLMCSWDCGWYTSIMTGGYDLAPHAHPNGDAANWAFFPLFPLLTKALADSAGIHILVASTIIVNLSFIVAMCVLYEYLKKLVDEDAARFTAVLLAFSPYSLYFSAPYTEALYFLLMVSTLYCASSDKWIAAGLFAAALSATRNLGVLLFFPLLAIGIKQHGLKPLIKLSNGTERVILCLSLVPLGLFLYMFYLHQHVGDALAFKHVQVAWGRTVGSPFRIIGRAFSHENLFLNFSAVIACFGLFCGGYLLKKRFFTEGIILLIGTIIPLTTSINSIARYTFSLFPIYLAIVLLTDRSPRIRMFVLYLFISLSGFCIMSWITGKDFMT
ncbi:MAG: mannosyltransferase family protein [Exilibacterium sp.]